MFTTESRILDLEDTDARACEAALEALVFGTSLLSNDPIEIERLLDHSFVKEPHRSALIGQFQSRLPIYRTLVQTRLTEALEQMLPNTTNLLGAHWPTLFSQFLESVGPKSPILRELLTEWVTWFRAIGQHQLEILPWLADFALFEALSIESAAQGQVESAAEPPSVTSETHLVRNEKVIFATFEWAVHEWSLGTVGAPAQRLTSLAVYTDEENVFRILELSPIAVRIWQLIEKPICLRTIVSTVLSEYERSNSPSLESLSSLFAEFHGRGLCTMSDSSGVNR
jgi:hypothetical protein